MLERLGIAEDAGRLVRELPYGRQRLVEIAVALGLAAQRCCCWTSRRRACRRRKAASSSRSSRACRPTSRCSSSSTTWTWCSASPGASPCWCRARCWWRDARGDRRRPARARGLSRRARRTMSDLLARGRARRLRRDRGAGRRFAGAARRRHAGGARAERRRQDHAARHHPGPYDAARRRDPPRRAARSAASRLSARAARHRLRAAGARDLPLAHRRGEPDGGRSGRDAGRWRGSTTSFRASPSAGGTRATSFPAASSRCWRSAAR